MLVRSVIREPPVIDVRLSRTKRFIQRKWCQNIIASVKAATSLCSTKTFYSTDSSASIHTVRSEPAGACSRNVQIDVVDATGA